jgi:hypothetical protein
MNGNVGGTAISMELFNEGDFITPLIQANAQDRSASNNNGSVAVVTLGWFGYFHSKVKKRLLATGEPWLVQIDDSGRMYGCVVIHSKQSISVTSRKSNLRIKDSNCAAVWY